MATFSVFRVVFFYALALLGLAGIRAPLAVAETPIALRAVLAETDYPPYYFVDPDSPHTNKITGFSVEVCQAIAADLGFSLDFVREPFSRMLASLTNGHADIACTLFNTSERAPGILYTATPHAFEAIYLIRERSQEPPSLANLNATTLGLVSGYYYGEAINLLNGSPQRYFTDDLQLIKNFARQRVEVIASNLPTFLWHARQLGIDTEAFSFSDKPIFEGPIYIGLSRKQMQALPLLAQFNERMVEFRKTSQYQALLDKYQLSPPPY